MSPALADGLYSFLSGLSGLTAHTSAIRPHVAEQADDLPYVVYTSIAIERTRSQAPGATGNVEESVQIDCYADTAATARAMAEAVRVGLDNFRGAMGTVVIDITNLDTQAEFYERPQSGEQIGVFRVLQEYAMHYGEP